MTHLEAVVPESLPDPPEPYSYAIRSGQTLYLAGQVALGPDNEVVGTSVGEQAEQVWSNIEVVLAAAGGSLRDVVKVTYYMQDIRELAEEMPIRRRIFAGRPLPAVTAIQAAALGLPGLKLEVDVIAVLTP